MRTCNGEKRQKKWRILTCFHEKGVHMKGKNGMWVWVPRALPVESEHPQCFVKLHIDADFASLALETIFFLLASFLAVAPLHDSIAF